MARTSAESGPPAERQQGHKGHAAESAPLVLDHDEAVFAAHAGNPLESPRAIIFQYLYPITPSVRSSRSTRRRPSHASRPSLLLTPTTMTRESALASGVTRFFAGPLVGSALLVGSLTTLTGNLFLPSTVD